MAEAFNMIWRGRTTAGAQYGQLKRSVSNALMVFPTGFFDKIWGKDNDSAGERVTNCFDWSSKRLSFFKERFFHVSEITRGGVDSTADASPSLAVQPTIEEVQEFIASLHAAKSPKDPQSKASPNVGKVSRTGNLLIVGYEDLDLPIFTARNSNNAKVSPRPRPSAGRPRRLLSSPRTIDNMLAD